MRSLDILTKRPRRDIPPLLPKEHYSDVKREVQPVLFLFILSTLLTLQAQVAISLDQRVIAVRAFADTSLGYDIIATFCLETGAVFGFL